MKLDTEEWRAVAGWESKFEVSNLGRIRSKTRYVRNGNGIRMVEGRILKGYQGADRRVSHVTRVCGSEGHVRFLVHRLVACAFIPNPEALPMINHIDGDPSNNRIENLEWCTAKQNAVHALRTGLIKPMRIKRDGSRRQGLSIEQVKKIRELLSAGDSLSAIGRRYGVLPTTIWRIKNQTTWSSI